MSENEKNETPVDSAPQVSPTEAINQLKDLFSTLVPPETLEIQDAFGNTHLTRASIPARAQIKVMQQLDAIWSADTSEIEISSGAGGIAGISRLVIQLCSNEVLFESICGAFAYAHPKAVRDAAVSALESGVPEADTKHPADLFPVEEIVAGLVPFFMRLASRAANLMTQVTSQSSQIEATN